MTVYAENRKARFDYEILETLEAGIELLGFEVKSIRTGRAQLAGTFATIQSGELWLLNATISPYQAGNVPADYDPARSRRLLLKRREIEYLAGKMQSEKLTIVPLKLYNKGGLVKLELGVARGKKKYDKRETIKKREVEREIGRTLKR